MDIKLTNDEAKAIVDALMFYKDNWSITYEDDIQVIGKMKMARPTKALESDSGRLASNALDKIERKIPLEMFHRVFEGEHRSTNEIYGLKP